MEAIGPHFLFAGNGGGFNLIAVKIFMAELDDPAGGTQDQLERRLHSASICDTSLGGCACIVCSFLRTLSTGLERRCFNSAEV